MMKDFKSKEILLEVVKSKIWMMFGILRSEDISLSDYYVLLFLLSAYKDGLISHDLVDGNQHLKESLIERLHNSNNEASNQYAPIIHSFEPTIRSLSENSLRHFLNILTGIDTQILNKNFSDIFDSILYQISKSQRGNNSNFIQPVELTRFMCGLAELKTDASVFSPFAGLASFSIYLDQDQNYFGQELNQKTWTLGVLRLMAYKKLDKSSYVCEDSILHWPESSEKFDLIITNAPFGMYIGGQYKEIEPRIKTINQFLIEKGLHSLKQNGKLIALLPQSFIFRRGCEERFKKYLIEEDLIDTIISLPSGLLLNTLTPSIILVLGRTKIIPGKVRFIDAKHFVIAKGHREKVLNDESLNSFIHSNKEDENVVRIIDNEQIRSNQYNLSIARYFKKQIDGVKLGNILEPIRGQRINSSETGKLVRMRDLKDDKIDFVLDVSSMKKTELRKASTHLVSESCLLLSMHWKTLKPTFFEFKDEPIFRNHDILSFKVNESIVDKAYLINELYADYVQEQLESYRSGTSAMSFINKEDLMEVAIKLPSLEEQRAKIQGIYELSYKIKNLEEERNALAHGKIVNQFNEFASLKHTLGRPRQNILDWSDNLLDFLSKKKEEFETLNKAFAEFYDIDIISALEEIKRDINFITDVLERGENGLVLPEYEKQIIPLFDINSIINKLSNNGFNFKINKLLLKGENLKLKERGIYANKTLFKTLLDNILTNANKYAFDKKATGNEVVIELAEVDDFLHIEIKNNGKPFPKNFDREKFITKYSTVDSSRGSGLGGYDIHRIATDFNNPDWILSLNEDTFFLVMFKFKFPIKLTN